MVSVASPHPNMYQALQTYKLEEHEVRKQRGESQFMMTDKKVGEYIASKQVAKAACQYQQ